MAKIKIETINMWLEAIIWTIWTISVYGQFRMAGADMLTTLIFIATPFVMRKTNVRNEN